MTHIETLVPTDAELLAEFIRSREETSFQQLVHRHGPLVMGVCRQILRHQHDADDAFQATFIVLALRAKSVKNASSLASWLYRVAYRTAMRAAKRRQRQLAESVCEEVPVNDDPLEKIHNQSLQKALHEELSQMPESYRAPLVLCYLEQRTRQEAAAHLESTEAAVKARLARGKRMLRLRIARRGIALSVALSVTASELSEATAPVPPELLNSTMELCKSVAERGSLPTTECSPDIVSLAKESTDTMFHSTLMKSAAALVVASLCLSSYALHAGDGAGQSSDTTSIDLANAYAQTDSNNVRLAQAAPSASDSVLQAGGESEIKDARIKRDYLLDRAAAFQKLADAWKKKKADSDSERLENEARRDLYLAEVKRLRAEARSVQGGATPNIRPRLVQTTEAVLPSKKRNAVVAIADSVDRVPQRYAVTLSADGRTVVRTATGEVADANVARIASPGYATRRPVECCREGNLAYKAKAVASSEEAIRNNLASHAVDGDLSTRWCANGDGPAWLLIDLGEAVDINALRIHWEKPGTAYQYRILGSEDSDDWKTLIDGSDNKEAGHSNTHRVDANSTRYVRIDFVGNDRGFWGSIRELEVSDSELTDDSLKAWNKLNVGQSSARAEAVYLPTTTATGVLSESE